MIEEKHQIVRDDMLVIYDINLEYLRKIDYNIIKRKNIRDLKKILYIFICDNNKILDDVLYYDPIDLRRQDMQEEIDKAVEEAIGKAVEEAVKQAVKEGRENGIKEGRKEIINELILDFYKNNMSIDEISKLLKIDKNEINIHIESNKNNA